jgi:hypothetical protein
VRCQQAAQQSAATDCLGLRSFLTPFEARVDSSVVLLRAALSQVIINNMNERAAAIIINDGFLLLMHRKKPNKEYYVLPGGGVESDETPEATCIREVEEETGLVVTLAKKVLALNNEGTLRTLFPREHI